MKILPTDKCLETIPMASQDAGDGRTEGGYGGCVQTTRCSPFHLTRIVPSVMARPAADISTGMRG
jgi:hypothetical protein